MKNPPANVGDMGLIPALGRSHMLGGQLSSTDTTTEPMSPGVRALLCNKRNHHSEKPTSYNKRVAAACCN